MKKLRVIIFLVAEFNVLHKLAFNIRLTPNLEANYMTPKITRGRKHLRAMNLAVNKKLLCDVSNVSKKPMITLCADNTNC